MIKWDLYRKKVEQVEDDYAEFKKQQKRILIFNHLISFNTIMTRLRDNFYQHKEITYRKRVQIYLVNQVRKNIKLHFNKRGDETKIKQDWIRYCFTAHVQTMIKQERESVRNIHKFLKKTAGNYELKTSIIHFHKKALKAQEAIRKALDLQNERKAELNKFFESEKTIMRNHHFSRQKKLSSKRLYEKLTKYRSEDPPGKQAVLECFYEYISGVNLQKAISFNASAKMKERKEDEPLYG